MPPKKIKVLPSHTVDQQINKLKKVQQYLYPPYTSEKFTLLQQALNNFLIELSEPNFIEFSRNFILPRHQDLLKENPRNNRWMSISLESALYRDIIYIYWISLAFLPNYFGEKENAKIVEEKKDIFLKIAHILNDTKHLSYLLETYVDFQKKLNEYSFQKLPTTEKMIIYECLCNCFEYIRHNIAEEKKSPSLTPENREKLIKSERNNYISIIQQTHRILSDLNDYSKIMKYINKAIDSHLKFCSAVYFSILQIISRTPDPNLRTIFWCFNGIKEQNDPLAIFETPDPTLLSSELIDHYKGLLNQIDPYWLFKLSGCAGLDLKCFEMLFIYIFLALKMGVKSSKSLTPQEVETVFHIVDKAKEKEALRFGWKVILDVFKLTKQLTPVQQEIVYQHCDERFFDESAHNLEPMLSLISTFVPPNISHVKRIKELFDKKFNSNNLEPMLSLISTFVRSNISHGKQIKNPFDICNDFILNSLENTKNFSDDFAVLFDGMNEIGALNNTKKIFSNLVIAFKNAKMHDKNETHDLFNFLHKHIDLIQQSLVTFNRFLRESHHYLVKFSNTHELCQDKEYQAYEALLELKENLIANLPSDSSHYFNSMLNLLIEKMTSEILDAIYLPSMKAQQLITMVETIQVLNARAKQHYISIDGEYKRIIRLLSKEKWDAFLIEDINEVLTNCHARLQKNEAKQVDAIEELKRRIDIKVFPENNIAAYIQKIRDYIAEYKYDAASALIALTKQTFPGQREKTLLYYFAKCAVGYKQYPTALAIYEKILSKEKTAPHSLMFQIAYCHRKIAGVVHREQALLLYDKLLKNNTEATQYAHLLNGKIMCLTEAGCLNEAEELISSYSAAEVDWRFLRNRGRIYFIRREYKKAIECYEKVMQLSPHIETQFALNQCYQLTGQTDRIPVFTRSMNENKFDYLQSMSTAVELKRQHQYKQALLILEHILSRVGINTDINMQMAGCYIGQNQFEKAVQTLLTIPDYLQNQRVLLILAQAYIGQGNQRAALETFEYLILTFNTFQSAYHNAIKYCIKIKDKKTVMHYWLMALEALEEAPNFLINIASNINKAFPGSIDYSPPPKTYSINWDPLLDTLDEHVELEDDIDDIDDIKEEQVEFESMEECLESVKAPKEITVVLEDSLPVDVIELLQNIAKNSKELYIVGSTVHSLRNKTALLNTQDVDITITMDNASLLVEAFGFQKSKYILNLYTCKLGPIHIDCMVVPTTPMQPCLIENDFMSRDFTICCLYCDMNGRIYDPTNKGIEDFEAQKLATIKDATTSFKEDPVRILRAMKHMVKGFVPDENIESALRDYKKMDNLTQGRINAFALKCFLNIGLSFNVLLNKYNLTDKLFDENPQPQLYCSSYQQSFFFGTNRETVKKSVLESEDGHDFCA